MHGTHVVALSASPALRTRRSRETGTCEIRSQSIDWQAGGCYMCCSITLRPAARMDDVRCMPRAGFSAFLRVSLSTPGKNASLHSTPRAALNSSQKVSNCAGLVSPSNAPPVWRHLVASLAQTIESSLGNAFPLHSALSNAQSLLCTWQSSAYPPGGARRCAFILFQGDPVLNKLPSEWSASFLSPAQC